MEILYGKFSSSILIPGETQINLIEAFYKEGILTVILPKKESIHVEVNED